jgi:hypothetical protein
MNGSPIPVFQYQLAEDYCLGSSKTGHSKERFSEPALLLKNHSYCLKTVHTYEWFSKPFIHSMIRLKEDAPQTWVQSEGKTDTKIHVDGKVISSPTKT